MFYEVSNITYFVVKQIQLKIKLVKYYSFK